MKICFIANAASIHTQRWAEYFVGKGHKIHIITHHWGDIHGARIHKLMTLSGINFVNGPIQTRRIIKKIRPDIVHAHYVSNYGFYGAMSGFHPFIVSTWGSDIAVAPERYPIIKFFVRYALRKADLVHTGDIPGKKRLMELGCDENKIFVQPHGVDTESFSPNAYSEKLRGELGISDKYSVLNARWLKPSYNVDVFIKAIPLVLREVDKPKFIVGGGGPQEKELKELTKKLGIEKHVIFLGGIPHEEMPKYLASVDLYVDSHKAPRKAGGGIGTTTMEAMACALPLVMVEKPYLRLRGRKLEDQPWFHGSVCEHLDQKEMAEKIVALLKNEKLRKEIGKKCRETALRIGDWTKNMMEWEKIYDELTKGGSCCTF